MKYSTSIFQMAVTLKDEFNHLMVSKGAYFDHN